MKFRRFEDMPVWIDSILAAQIIYEITNDKRWAKEYSLKEQIRRAIISVSSNIAEGYEYDNPKQFVRYLRIAKGSIGEVRSQLHLALRLKYVDEEKHKETIEFLSCLSKQLSGFIKYLKVYNRKVDQDSMR